MDSPSLHVALQQRGPIPLDVHFTCAAGRTVALIGPSGAGKTTILRSIAGLYWPATAHIICNGSVWLDTRDGTARAPHDRRTGLVFQSYALFPHLSARDNVAIALAHLPRAARATAADACLARVGLSGAGSRRPSSLSGGEQQRVALARALAREPDVLLLDEPFSAIDRPTRRRLHADLAALKSELRAPIILVTHDIEEALALADDVVVIERGSVVHAGTVQEIKSGFVSDRLRALLDLPEPAS